MMANITLFSLCNENIWIVNIICIFCKTLYSLINLQKLDLYDNKLKKMPNEIGNIINLNEL